MKLACSTTLFYAPTVAQQWPMGTERKIKFLLKNRFAPWKTWRSNVPSMIDI